MKQKKIAIAGVSAAMLLGAGAGVVLNLPGGAGATGADTAATTDSTADSTATTDTVAPTDTTVPTTDASDPTTSGADARPHPLQDSLAALVADGTITQAQADAITAAIDAIRPQHDGVGPRGSKPGTTDDEGADSGTTDDGSGPRGGRGGRGGGHPGFGGFGGGGFGLGVGGAVLDAAAGALGITTDELQTDLQDGKSIADVAVAHGVDVQTVIDAIVAEATTTLKDRITDMVNGVRPTPPTKPATTTPETTTPDTTPDTTAGTTDDSSSETTPTTTG